MLIILIWYTCKKRKEAEERKYEVVRKGQQEDWKKD
jgi:hypothetical protein